MAIVRIWRRDLFPAEKRVNFKVLEERWDNAEKAFVDTVAPILKQMMDKLLADIKWILEEKKYGELKDIQLGYRGKLVNAIKLQLIDAFELGKGQAFSELRVRRDILVSQEAKQYFAAKAEAIVANLYDKIKSTTIFVVLAGIRMEYTVEQILFEVKGEAYKGVLD